MVVTQHLSKDAAAKMVQYYKQNNSINYISCTNMSKMVLSDMASNGKLVLYGPLGKCMEFQGKKVLFKISTLSFVLRMI